MDIRCGRCKEYKPPTEFHKNKRSKNGLANTCKPCAITKSRELHARRFATDPSYKRAKKDSYVKYRHGISLEEYEAMLETQGGECAVCGTPSPKGGWHLDHNHLTNELRGFLCNPCNRGIGYLQDDINLLMKAIEYLKRTGSYATGSEGRSQ